MLYCIILYLFIGPTITCEIRVLGWKDTRHLTIFIKLIGAILNTIEKIYQNVFLFDDDFYNYLAIIFVFEYIYTYIIFLYYVMWKLSMKDTWCKFINFYTVYFRLCFSKGKRNYCQRQYSFVKNLSRSRKENLS